MIKNRGVERIHTDSKRVCAECPKMNEKPKMIVASGTSEVRVFCGLKIRRQMKMITMRTTQIKTASNLATIESTSCRVKWVGTWLINPTRNQAYFETRNQRFSLPIDALYSLAHFAFGNIAISVFIKQSESIVLQMISWEGLQNGYHPFNVLLLLWSGNMDRNLRRILFS